MSLLQPATLAVLRAHRASEPLFKNAMMAETFDAAHTRGALRILPRTDGAFALVDERRPLGNRTLGAYQTADVARHALESIAGRP